MPPIRRPRDAPSVLYRFPAVDSPRSIASGALAKSCTRVIVVTESTDLPGKPQRRPAQVPANSNALHVDCFPAVTTCPVRRVGTPRSGPHPTELK
jgi:hypothetical protein